MEPNKMILIPSIRFLSVFPRFWFVDDSNRESVQKMEMLQDYQLWGFYVTQAHVQLLASRGSRCPVSREAEHQSRDPIWAQDSI